MSSGLENMDSSSGLTFSGRAVVILGARYDAERGIHNKKRISENFVIAADVDKMLQAEALASALSRLSYLSGVQLLRYHNFGMQKYEQLSQPYSLTDTPPATQEEVIEQSSWFAEAGLIVLQTRAAPLKRTGLGCSF